VHSFGNIHCASPSTLRAASHGRPITSQDYLQVSFSDGTWALRQPRKTDRPIVTYLYQNYYKIAQISHWPPNLLHSMKILMAPTWSTSRRFTFPALVFVLSTLFRVVLLLDTSQSCRAGSGTREAVIIGITTRVNTINFFGEAYSRKSFLLTHVYVTHRASADLDNWHRWATRKLLLSSTTRQCNDEHKDEGLPCGPHLSTSSWLG
jgi:hypothetical protein